MTIVMNQDKLEDLEWEKEIAHKINTGDEKAFQEILNRYTSQVLNYIYRSTGDKESAEELTQEVFLRLWRARKKYRLEAKLSTFLYRIATNIIIDYKRKKNRKSAQYSLDKPLELDSDSIERQIPDNTSPDDNHITDNVKSAILSLPSKQRIAITLRIYEGKNYKEISEIIGYSKSAVESLLFRTRRNLKEKLEYLSYSIY